jgi:hypothetical protein
MAYEFTEITDAEQEQAIRNRIRDLESQYLQISLRVTAPSVGEVQNSQDADNLKQILASIESLRALIPAAKS